MDKLPVDILVLMALDMATEDAIKWCLTGSPYNNAICNNPQFWRSKLEQDYNFFPHSNNVNTLRHYYQILYKSYTLGRYNLGYDEATENKYQELVAFMDKITMWGIIDAEGTFRIGKLNLGTNRNWITRRTCMLYNREELLTIINQLTDNTSNFNNYNTKDLCDLIKQTLESHNRLYVDKKVKLIEKYT